MYTHKEWKSGDIITSNGLNNLESGVATSLSESVLLYGAVGDGKHDDTQAIQAALDAAKKRGGGTVHLPTGTYIISDVLHFYANMVLEGSSQEATIIKQTANKGHLVGIDASNSSLRDLTFLGQGIDGGAGGIGFGRENNGNTLSLHIENVTLKDSAGGISVSTPITSTFTNVRSQGIADSGFSLYGSGTSVVMSNCYALTCANAGFNLDQLNYSVLIGCAAEVCGVGYNLTNNCNNVSLIGCGAEDNIKRSDAMLGDDFMLTGGVGCSLVSCYSRNSVHAGVVLKGANSTSIIGYREIGDAKTGLSGDANVKNLTLAGNSIQGVTTLDKSSMAHAGATDSRPKQGLYAGYEFFDTTLSKPVYYTGDKWVDATGTAL